MRDPFAGQRPNLSDPGITHAEITPSDSVDIDPAPRALWVIVAGDVAIRDAGGTDITYPDVPVGLFPFRATRVLTATTATVVAWR